MGVMTEQAIAKQLVQVNERLDKVLERLDRLIALMLDRAGTR